ncbi:hypothetical protein [Thalassospira xiamenensis]|uniref:Uncharacterized protein n=1 Tax=Thalassospira xiamenensis TaxID=220697 RepID=A0A285TXL1_9PROT|nr:hypothetical protein [Thalassospira xiamenensis]SOC30527.1 hypothetical protein SAMN05428964_10978 [Thalassospira xiamenensis]
MKYGYSLLLREFVTAEEVQFGDCEQFQISCPICREPVYKKTRDRQDGLTTHFLSHYRAETEEEKDCENRVTSAMVGKFGDFSAEGREQTLRKFIAVMTEAILDSQAHIIPKQEHRKLIERLMSREIFKDFSSYGKHCVDLMINNGQLENFVKLSIANSKDFSKESEFWHRRQTSYVVDVLLHMNTARTSRSLDFLIAAAIVNLGRNAKNFRRERAIDEVTTGEKRYLPMAAIDIIEAAVNGKSKTAIQNVIVRSTGLNSGKPKEEVDAIFGGIRNAIVSELIGPMCGILASVPFVDLATRKHSTRDEFDKGMEGLLEFIQTFLLSDNPPSVH